ncbi:MAG: class I SAM-dependent methyltransferase [Acidobacteria bacterium]|nr:class I SAM-dependent methyltransferase [Acidobacteriota bacterium]
MATIDQNQFVHRVSYEELPVGRDRYHVACLAQWLPNILRKCVRETKGIEAVLDVGCGEQPLRELIESLGATYLGMDVCQNAQANVEVIGAIDDPALIPEKLNGNAYALIVCTEVLEHVADWATGLANLRNLLKSGGRLILTVPFSFPLHMEPFDFYRVTPHGIRKLADQYGFEIEQQECLGNALDVLSTVLDDVSILPSNRNLTNRIKSRMTQVGKRRLVQLLQSKFFRAGLTANSNFYLNNAVVLRAAEGK